MTDAVRAQNLSKIYGTGTAAVTALDNVSLTIARGTVAALLGPSGSGKSTLIKALGFVSPADTGEVFFEGRSVVKDGVPLEDLSRLRRRHLGFVFQKANLTSFLSARENVEIACEFGGKADGRSRARELLRYLDVGNREDSYPEMLSGGEQQRVAIARALANEPRILLMDEPFGALDAMTRCKMQKYLLDIWKKVDVTIVFITHDLDEAIFLADRILVLGTDPGGVREIIENSVPRPRSQDQLLSAEFLALKGRLDDLIHGQATPDEDKLPLMGRMTLAGDDVE